MTRNHNGVVTHLACQPAMLECEVERALGSIIMNRISGGDEIPAELFQIQKMMLLRCCNQYASKFGKLISDHWKN